MKTKIHKDGFIGIKSTRKKIPSSLIDSFNKKIPLLHGRTIQSANQTIKTIYHIPFHLL